MTKTQFEAETGRRAELRNANEKVLTYMVEEIGPELRLPRDTFDKYVKDDQTLARHLLGVLLRKAIDHNPDGATYLLIGEAIKKVEVTPEALLTTLEDLKNIFAAGPPHGETWIDPAYFRKLVEGTIRHLNEEGTTTLAPEVEKAYADYSNEALAASLISTMLAAMKSDRERLEIAAESMDLANKTLKLMLEDAQAKDAWIKKKRLVYPGRGLKKAA